MKCEAQILYNFHYTRNCILYYGPLEKYLLTRLINKIKTGSQLCAWEMLRSKDKREKLLPFSGVEVGVVWQEGMGKATHRLTKGLEAAGINPEL